MTAYLTKVGFAVIANRILGSGTEPKYVGWGTGASAASTSSTDLSTPKNIDFTSTGTDRTTATGTRVTTTETNDTTQYVATRTATGGTGTVTNVGLFDAVTGGNMAAIVDGQSIVLADGDSIVATFKIKFA